MSGWEKVEENNQTFWVSEEHGNVYKLSDGAYIAMLPKVLKFGTFKTPEEAQKVLETCKEKLDQILELYNQELTNK